MSSHFRSHTRGGIAIAMLGLLALAGCAQTTRLTDQVYPPKPDDAPIEVFASGVPNRPYIEIALVSEESEMTTRQAKLIESLKRQARKVGADAIILQQAGTRTQGGGGIAHTNPTTGITTFNSIPTQVGVAQGVAIKWK